MSLIPVQSSNLAAVGYDGGTLIIEFHDGRVYEYYRVPYSEYHGLMSADSPGRYFHKNINKHYAYRRLQ